MKNATDCLKSVDNWCNFGLPTVKQKKVDVFLKDNYYFKKKIL